MSHQQPFSSVGTGLPGLKTSSKLGLMYLAQGHKAVTPVRLEPAAPLSRVKHSTTELPLSWGRYGELHPFFVYAYKILPLGQESDILPNYVAPL